MVGLLGQRTAQMHLALLTRTGDPAFERLYASDMMDDALLWQRIRLAMEAGNGGLDYSAIIKLIQGKQG